MLKCQTIEIGDHVVCDLCNADWTGKPDRGGFLFGSKAVGPCCEASFRETVRKHDEEWYIKAECPPDMSFAEWCIELRGGNNTIRIYT